MRTLEEMDKRVHDIDHMLARAVPNLANRVARLEERKTMENEPMCAMPSVDERIDGLRRDVNALFRLLPDNLEREQEEKRQARWHATYNAALTGVMANGGIDDGDYPTGKECHDIAEEQANIAHGPLCASSEPEQTPGSGSVDNTKDAG